MRSNFYTLIDQLVEVHADLLRENARLQNGHQPSRAALRTESGSSAKEALSTPQSQRKLPMEAPNLTAKDGFQGVILNPDDSDEEVGKSTFLKEDDFRLGITKQSSSSSASSKQADPQDLETKKRNIIWKGRANQSVNAILRPKVLDCWGAFNIHEYEEAAQGSEASDEVDYTVQLAQKNQLKRANLRVGASSAHMSHRLHWLVVRPSSTKRITWDLTSTLMLLYDLFLIPLEVFAIPNTALRVLLDWITTLFWIADMFVSAVSGYYEDEIVELRLSKTCQRYLRTWFPIDVCTVSVDMLLLMLGAGISPAVGALRLNKTARLMRVMRFLRVVRIRKVRKALAELMDNIQSEYMRILLSIVILLLFIIILNHYIACAWYGVGDANWGHYNMTWIRFHARETAEYAGDDEQGDFYWYSTSLHWSLTQFTPASMEVHAVNSTERLFSVGVLLFALVTFSSFLSSITASMTHLRQLQKQRYETESIVRKYFWQNDISAELGVCILKHLKRERKGKRRRYMESEVPALQTLPESLMMRIHEEVYLPSLMSALHLEHYAARCPRGAQEICHRAATMKHLRSGEKCFFEGEPGVKTVFVSGGNMEYMCDDDFANVLQSGVCIAEQCLWMEWYYAGRLTGGDICECIELDGEAFRKVVLSDIHVAAREITFLYAQMYSSFFFTTEASKCTDLADGVPTKIILHRARAKQQAQQEEEPDAAEIATDPATKISGGRIGSDSVPRNESRSMFPSSSWITKLYW
mmetsp:Transcript_43182/g.99548  ORF Transcript_43182/g.99548 Transcript_43182/m.99548 type:complete len:753 (+) Transcript_43182:116-2374(+)